MHTSSHPSPPPPFVLFHYNVDDACARRAARNFGRGVAFCGEGPRLITIIIVVLSIMMMMTTKILGFVAVNTCVCTTAAQPCHMQLQV